MSLGLPVRFSDIFLLGYGFLFTFFIPGFSVVETLYKKIPLRIKIPLYFILSLLISTYLVYIVSLFTGFSRLSILYSSLLFLPIFFYTLLNEVSEINQSLRKTKLLQSRQFKTILLQLVGGLVIFLIFFLALNPGIFTQHNGYIVLSVPNWQDTSMHLGIIESITQGNFPPQAPYYAGQPLNYYFFADFHASILNEMFGKFFPRMIVYDNSLLAAIFFLSVFALMKEVIKERWISFFAALSVSLFGNYLFIHFFKELFLGNFPNLLRGAKSLIASNVYSIEYNGLFQASTMADYFLQNRPMMIGLPTVVLVTVLFMRAVNGKNFKLFVLLGVLTGLLVKFQLFASLVSVLIIALGYLVFFSLKKFKFLVASALLFLFTTLAIYLPFLVGLSINGNSLMRLVVENFRWGAWDIERSLSWYINFSLGNYGAVLTLALVAALGVVINIFKRKKPKRQFLFSLLLGLILFSIPFICSFTIYNGDMFKFFYFSLIFLTLVSFYIVSKIKIKFIKISLASFLVIICCFTSVLTLLGSAWNKNMAYSLPQFKAGMWMRENTPERSVFLTMPTLHSPTTQIAGRLRVLSYINWPYSHGFNTGEDNVFSRLYDIEKVYEGADPVVLKRLLDKYNVDYLYLGSEEYGLNPNIDKVFDNLTFLKLAYNQEGIRIYEYQQNQ